MIQHLFHQPRMGRRLWALFISVSLMGVGVAIFDQLGFGTDPCSSMNLAISRQIGWSFGNWQLTLNVLLLIIVLATKEFRMIGLGSVANMVIIGYVADFATWIINSIHPLYHEPLLVKLLIFAPTMLMFLVAVSFYMVVDLGVAPYDAVPMIVAKRFKWPFSIVRMAWDLSVIMIAIVLGGTVGLVTLITGFCLGPLYGMIANRIRPMFEP